MNTTNLQMEAHKYAKPVLIVPRRSSNSLLMDSEPTQTLFPAETPTSNPEIISKSSPVPHTLITTPAFRSIKIGGWTITSRKLPISSSSDCDSLAAKLGIPVPEMTFGNNAVSIEAAGGWKCEFNTQEALDAVDKTGSQGIKVSYSEQWNRTRYCQVLLL
jgi:TIP41-like family